MAVASTQRFTPAHTCPICGGHERLPRGHGRRCHGFRSSDGAWAHCSREEYANGLPYESCSDTYAHRLDGDCRCGVRHDPRPAAPRIGADRARIPIAVTYEYADADGTLLFQVLRRADKTFTQRRPDGAGGWIYNLDGVRRVLYRLAGLLAADPRRIVFVPEGEKDVDRLTDLGLVATTNPGGAGKWRGDYAAALRGRHVVILPDNDVPGRRHSWQVTRSLHGVAASVKIIDLPGLPPKGDVSDWLDRGGTVKELRRLVRTAPDWGPTERTRACRPSSSQR
jgi:hypothetical protein